MALTQEQIKNLKPGDNLLLEAFFVEKDGDNIKFTFTPPYVPDPKVFSVNPYSLRFLCGSDRTFCHAVDSMVKPKHDPCRMFKKGDWVRIVKHQGRKFNAAPPAFQLGKTYRVSEDENTEHCYVMLQSCDLHYAHPVAFLELVTPVEEWMPYHIKKAAEFDAWFICNRNNDVIFHFNPDPCNLMMDMAEIEKLAREECDYLNERFRDLIGKSAAEAECERLNAEWQAKVCRSDEGKEADNG